MKNKLIKFLTFLPLTATLFSCAPVTPCAFFEYKDTNQDLYIYISPNVYSGDNLKVYKNEAEFHEEYSIAEIEFSFPKSMGRIDNEDKSYLTIDITRKNQFIIAYVYKNGILYDEAKDFYLNGVKLVNEDKSEELEIIKPFLFNLNNSDYIRGNPNGKIDFTKINTIEYK